MQQKKKKKAISNAKSVKFLHCLDVFLTYLRSIVTSGSRSTTGSGWASNARSTTLTRESSVTLKERKNSSATKCFASKLMSTTGAENGLLLQERGYSLLVQLGQKVLPHQEHPE